MVRDSRHFHMGMIGLSKRSMSLLIGMSFGFAQGVAQLATGTLEGLVENGQGQAAASAHLEIVGPLAQMIPLTADSQGRFSATLPYGTYTVRAPALYAACRARIWPLETTRCVLREGENRSADGDQLLPSTANNPAQLLLFETPGAAIYPLDFENLGSIRLPLITGQSAAQWTATSFRLNGLDATDSYQPGRPVTLDDAAATDSISVRQAYAAGGAPLDAFDTGVFLRSAENSWHFGIATQDTGAALASSNLPPVGERGSVERPEVFRWFTRDSAKLDAVIGHWADIAATASGQWASQTSPDWADGTLIRSRILLGNVRGRARLSARDQLDALYSGSRLDLSNGGWPAGIEAFLASPLMPSFYGVEGFENLREVDHFDLVQVGWTHQFDSARILEFRYGYSTAHLDTTPVGPTNAPSTLDLLDLAPTDSPLSNFAIRTRHEAAAVYQGEGHHAGLSHRFVFGGDWETSQPRNRFESPLGADMITAAGQPAFVVRLNTPADTRVRVNSFTPSAEDVVRFAHDITLDLAIVLDTSRGAVAGQPDMISWVSPSPRAGIAAPVPGFSRMVVRGSYARTYARLAGRYLDFADPAALSGLVYDAQTGQLLERFGGAYSSIAPGLKRPYADEFHAGLRLDLPYRSAFSLDMLRRDDKQRIATIDTGVSASAYQPVVIQEPSPFEDQSLVVYAQNPATLGHDAYLLTNPPGLRELVENLTASATTHQLHTDIRASFTAEKSFGPTNPGNSAWVNDPGIIGALYSNPNTLINATGHPFMDRAFIGKFQTVTQTPEWLGGVELVSTVNYLDGLPFARELLITGLPQGPFLVDTTLRGSPEGGNRAQYVLNWNLRIAREFPVRLGRFTLATDLLNVLNNGNKIVESDLTSPLFSERPALAFPPPRTLRLSAGWSF